MNNIGWLNKHICHKQVYQLIVDPITAILTIDTNIVTKYQGMNKEYKKN